jgi:SAM-dependent methyltransferase
VQINPQPVVHDVERRYREFYGNDYLLYGLKNEAVFLELQKLAFSDSGFFKIEQQLLNRNGDPPSVLDIGCATGAILEYLKNRGWQTVGVEISPAAEYAKNVRKLDIQNSALENCSFPSESFDVVLASHLIEHLNNPGSFLCETMRILRCGGYLILTTPNIDGFQARLFGNRWRSAIFDHLYLFSTRTLKAILISAGFMIEGVFTWGGLATGTAPIPVKRFADTAVKFLGIGDVMIAKARKV